MHHDLTPFLLPVFGDDLTDKMLRGPQDGADVSGTGVDVHREPYTGGEDGVIAAVPLRYTWCIDAGHGRLTEGKRSPKYPTTIISQQDRLLEWEFNRDVAERIIEQLVAYGRSFMRTMPQDGNYGNALTRRVKNANDHQSNYPKLFVSIHGNAGPAQSINDYCDDEVQGIETWHDHGSSKGRNLAAVFQRHLIAETGMKNRHLRSKPTGQFYVLRATRMTSILTENGFFNNRYDLEKMATPEFRQQVADAHVAAIMEVEKNGL